MKHALGVKAQQVVLMKTCSADWWQQTEASMRSVPVVLVYPRSEVLFSLCGVLVGAGICPFVECSFDEALCLAVGLGPVGPGAPTLDAECLELVAPGIGAITDAVIGDDGLGFDAVTLVEAERRVQEVQHGGALFIRVYGREGKPAMVVDGDMDELGTDARHLVAAVAGDPVRGTGDARQALDVDVQHVARSRVLVPHNHRSGFQIAHPVELEPTQDAADGGAAQAGGARDPEAGPTLTAQYLHALDLERGCGVTNVLWPRAAILQPRRTLLPIAANPFGRRLRADVEAGRGQLQRQPFF